MEEEELASLPARAGGNRRGDERRQRPLTTDALRELVQNDPQNILLRLSSEKGGLDELLRDACLSDTKILRLLQAVDRSFSPDMLTQLQHNIAEVVNKMLNSDFLNVTLYSFLWRCKGRIGDEGELHKILNATVKLLRYSMEISPAFAYPKVMYFPSLLRQSFEIADELTQSNLQRFEDLLNQHGQQGRGCRDGVGAAGDRACGMRIDRDSIQPVDNFRAIPLIPPNLTEDELVLRRSRDSGAYTNLEDYLDVQFRLFRADLLLPLRENINKYLGNHDGDSQRTGGGRIRVYHDVQIVRPVCTDRDISYRLWFDASRLRSVDWQSTQRLKFGSLVCLSRDNFQTYICAVVQERDPALLKNGLIDVTFILSQEEMQQVHESSRDDRYVMVESPAYFEAYRHVLEGLKNLNDQNFPFVRYIVDCNTQINPPAYLQQDGAVSYDFQPLLDDNFIIKDQDDPSALTDVLAALNDDEPQQQTRREVEVVSWRDWPTFRELKLDDSQYVALHSALTREFAIIQGPPGTGKTYLGLKILKMLLHNSRHWSDYNQKRPMLVVCYTNHALDQFLEGILQFFQGSLVRVGARSKSERMKDYNLNSLRVRARANRRVPMEVHEAKVRARNELRDLQVKIHGGAAKLEIAEQEVVNESFLKSHISDALMRSFDHQRPGAAGESDSAILKWLKLESLHERLIEQAEHNLKQLPPARRSKSSYTGRTHKGDSDADEDDDESIDISESFSDSHQSRQLDDDDDDSDLEFDFDVDVDEGIDKVEMDTQRIRRLLEQMELETRRIRDVSIALSISDFCKDEEKDLKDRTVPKPSKEQNKKVADNFCRLRQQCKRWLHGQLRSTDRMTWEEAEQVHSVWQVKVKDRWRLYRYWVDLFCRQKRGEIRQLEHDYHNKAQKYREILHQEDRTILENATIIGMTTTGAARYQSILQAIGPRIIIVEEAAEVFEAHVVATLSRECQHIILIGDHKQLRPNPVMHELAKKCNLDISLFERMVRNRFPYDCLEYQHRMRPEISCMMRLPDLYPKLKDHEVVQNCPTVLGVQHNVFYIRHSHLEDREEETKSFSNVFEAKYLVALCGYLLKQGYGRHQITILTPYSGQIRTIGRQMSKRDFDGVHLSSVDNFQGEENDIILLSLVRSNSDSDIGFLKMENRMCVALSRAKIGLYVIGNFETLKDGSKLLEDMVVSARRQKIMGPGLPLACQNHPRGAPIVAEKVEDFSKAPEGGCRERCSVRLQCGHVCPRTCHPATQKDHDVMKCSMSCSATCTKCGQVCTEKHECCEHMHCMNMVDKVVPRCGHTQHMACGEDPRRFSCQGQCHFVLDCGHQCQNPCGEPHTINCSEIVTLDGHPCQHQFQAKCSERDVAVCTEPCGETLVCGHTCQGTCGACSHGRLHVSCKQRCQKILACQHPCEATCCQCPPCEKGCQNRCHHSHCDKKCGQPCVSCRMMCAWNCDHKTCSKLCGEPCNRKRCNESCSLLIPDCGHPCMGLCGETCPPFCRICDEQILKNSQMAEIFGELEDHDRLVFLEDCCHAFEYKALDTWVEKFNPASQNSQKREEQEAGDQEDQTEQEHRLVKLPECPQCKTPIRQNLRYGNIIKACLEEIEIIKRRSCGDQARINDLDRKVEQAKARLPQHLKNRVETLQSDGGVKCEQLLAAQFYQITLTTDINQLLRQVSSAKTRWPDEHEIYQKLQADLDNFMDWTLHPRKVLSTQEVFDARQEFQRLRIVTRLLHCRHAISSDNIEVEERIMETLAANIRVLMQIGPVSEDYLDEGRKLQEELQNIVPDPYSALTDKEREAIVKAVSLPTGHWYACPRGHYYVIGECGRPTEVAQCPECLGVIGGESHALAEGNRFAPEIDNAEGPVWSVERDEEFARMLQEEEYRRAGFV